MASWSPGECAIEFLEGTQTCIPPQSCDCACSERFGATASGTNQTFCGRLAPFFNGVTLETEIVSMCAVQGAVSSLERCNDAGSSPNTGARGDCECCTRTPEQPGPCPVDTCARLGTDNVCTNAGVVPGVPEGFGVGCDNLYLARPTGAANATCDGSDPALAGPFDCECCSLQCSLDNANCVTATGDADARCVAPNISPDLMPPGYAYTNIACDGQSLHFEPPTMHGVCKCAVPLLP